MMDLATIWVGLLLLALNFALLAGIVVLDRHRRKWRARFLELDAMTPDQFKLRWLTREAGRRFSESLLESGRHLAKAFAERRPIPESGAEVKFRRPWYLQ